MFFAYRRVPSPRENISSGNRRVRFYFLTRCIKINITALTRTMLGIDVCTEDDDRSSTCSRIHLQGLISNGTVTYICPNCDTAIQCAPVHWPVANDVGATAFGVSVPIKTQHTCGVKLQIWPRGFSRAATRRQLRIV